MICRYLFELVPSRWTDLFNRFHWNMTGMTFSPDHPILWMRMSPVSSISSSDLKFKNPSKTNETYLKIVLSFENFDLISHWLLKYLTVRFFLQKPWLKTILNTWEYLIQSVSPTKQGLKPKYLIFLLLEYEEISFILFWCDICLFWYFWLKKI